MDIERKKLIVVLGMHRSGTSAMAGSLSFLGMDFDSNLVEAVPNDNPKGYWEPVEVVKINDDIFTAFNMHYMDFDSFPDGWVNHEAMNPIRHRINDWLKQSFLGESLIVVKDPRLCRTLPVWIELLEQQQVNVKYIHVFRHPMEVVGSLRTRDGTFSVVKGLLAWLAHVLDSFALYSPMHSAIVSYKELMNDPILALETVEGNLNLEWPVDPKTVAGNLKSFLEPSLVHQHFKGDIPYPPMNRLVQSVFDCLENYDLKSPDKDFYSCIEKYQIQFQEFRGLFEGALKSYSCKLQAEKANAAEQIAYRDALVDSLKGLLETKDEQLGSKKELLKLFFRPLKKGES